jgi:hypothetical protein
MRLRPLGPLLVLFTVAHAIGLCLHLHYLSDTDHLALPVRIQVNGQLYASSGRFVTEIIVGLKKSKRDELQTLTVLIGQHAFEYTAAQVNEKWQEAAGDPDRAGEPMCLLRAPPEVALSRTPLPFIGAAINSPGPWALLRGYLPWVVVSGVFMLGAWLLGAAAQRRPVLARAIRQGFGALEGVGSAGPEGLQARFSDWPWLLGGALVVLLAFARLESLEPCYFLQDDNLVQWFPAVRHACAALARAECPEWNPYQLGGAPVLSLGYFGLTYPPLFLSYLIATHLLGNDLWTVEVFALLHMLAGYLLGYACGRAARLRPAFAMAGALCMVLSGFTLITGRSWITLGITWLVFLPLLTLCLIRLWRVEVGWKWALFTGLAIGAWYHVGFTQMWIYGLAFFALAALLLWWSGALPARRLAWAALAVGHGLALTIPLLYVQADVIGEIDREKSYGNGIAGGAVASILPYPLATAVHPNEWGGRDSELMGQFYYWGTLFFAALLLAIMLALVLRGLWGRTFVSRNLWLILAAVALLLSLGEAGGLWNLLSVLPVFGRINNHAFRLLPELIFFGVLGGGLFLQRLLSAWPGWAARLRWLALGTVALVLYHVNLCRPAFYSYAERPYPALPPEMQQIFDVAPQGRILSFAPDRSSASRYMRGLRHGLPTFYQLPSLCGYDPLVESTEPYKTLDRKLREVPVQTAQALGVRWIVTGGPTAEPSWPAGTVNYHQAAYGPRARGVKFSPELAKLLENAAQTRLRLDGLRVSELPDSQPLAFWSGRPREPVAFRFRGEGLDIDLSGRPEGGQLVANFLWRPRWQALANGTALEIQEDEWGRMRVTVPPGTANVSLRFRPLWLQGCLLGLLLEAVALVGGLLLARWLTARRRTKVEPATLDDQRPLAHLEMNGQHVLAQHPQEKELQSR